jgi:hypothetical protein
MNRAVIAIDARDVIPLTARAQAKDDPIQHAPPIRFLATCGLNRIVGFEDGLDALPQCIGDFPQGRHPFGFPHEHFLLVLATQTIISKCVLR